jgi:hypothetical protein
MASHLLREIRLLLAATPVGGEGGRCSVPATVCRPARRFLTPSPPAGGRAGVRGAPLAAASLWPVSHGRNGGEGRTRPRSGIQRDASSGLGTRPGLRPGPTRGGAAPTATATASNSKTVKRPKAKTLPITIPVARSSSSTTPSTRSPESGSVRSSCERGRLPRTSSGSSTWLAKNTKRRPSPQPSTPPRPLASI